VARSEKTRAENPWDNGGLQEESRTQKRLLWKNRKFYFWFACGGFLHDNRHTPFTL